MPPPFNTADEIAVHLGFENCADAKYRKFYRESQEWIQAHPPMIDGPAQRKDFWNEWVPKFVQEHPANFGGGMSENHEQDIRIAHDFLMGCAKNLRRKPVRAARRQTQGGSDNQMQRQSQTPAYKEQEQPNGGAAGVGSVGNVGSSGNVGNVGGVGVGGIGTGGGLGVNDFQDVGVRNMVLPLDLPDLDRQQREQQQQAAAQQAAAQQAAQVQAAQQAAAAEARNMNRRAQAPVVKSQPDSRQRQAVVNGFTAPAARPAAVPKATAVEPLENFNVNQRTLILRYGNKGQESAAAITVKECANWNTMLTWASNQSGTDSSSIRAIVCHTKDTLGCDLEATDQLAWNGALASTTDLTRLFCSIKTKPQPQAAQPNAFNTLDDHDWQTASDNLRAPEPNKRPHPGTEEDQYSDPNKRMRQHQDPTSQPPQQVDMHAVAAGNPQQQVGLPSNPGLSYSDLGTMLRQETSGANSSPRNFRSQRLHNRWSYQAI